MGTPTALPTDNFIRSRYGIHRRGLLVDALEKPTSNGHPQTLSWSGQEELIRAFVGYAQSQLTETAQPKGHIRSAGPLADRALDWLRRSGFCIEDVHRLQFGLYSTPADVERFLTSVGFDVAQIGETRSAMEFFPLLQPQWSGCLVVPLRDRFSEVVDLGFVDFDRDLNLTMRWLRGATDTGIVAYGLDRVLSCRASDALSTYRSLILVDEVIDAMSLQSRGIENVAAVGELEEMSPMRWDALFDLGFAHVDLVFRNRAAQQAQIRQFLTTRLRAIRCPEVHVFDSTQFGPGESASEFVTRQGHDAFLRLLQGRTYVRRQWIEPDFGMGQTRKKQSRHSVAFQPERFWEAIDHRLRSIAGQSEESQCRHMAEDIARALMTGDFDAAHQMLDGWPVECCQNVALEPFSRGSVVSVAAALDSACSTDLDGDRLAWHDGSSDACSSDVTVIRTMNKRLRTERLIEILLNDLGADDDGLNVVLCEDGVQRFVTLMIHAMTQNQSQGMGLSVREVSTRLRGEEPMGGFRDKPWYVDEAIDQLHAWSGRLRFIDRIDLNGGLTHQLHQEHLQHGPIAGIYLDLTHLPFTEGKKSPAAEVHIEPRKLEQLASEFDCSVVAAISGQLMDFPVERPEQAAPSQGDLRRARRFFDHEAVILGTDHRLLMDFRSLLRHWIVQTERRTRFVPQFV